MSISSPCMIYSELRLSSGGASRGQIEDAGSSIAGVTPCASVHLAAKYHKSTPSFIDK